MVKISPQKSLELQTLSHNGNEPNNWVQKLQEGSQTSLQERRVYGASFKRKLLKNDLINTSDK